MNEESYEYYDEEDYDDEIEIIKMNSNPE